MRPPNDIKSAKNYPQSSRSSRSYANLPSHITRRTILPHDPLHNNRRVYVDLEKGPLRALFPPPAAYTPGEAPTAANKLYTPKDIRWREEEEKKKCQASGRKKKRGKLFAPPSKRLSREAHGGLAVATHA